MIKKNDLMAGLTAGALALWVLGGQLCAFADAADEDTAEGSALTLRVCYQDGESELSYWDPDDGVCPQIEADKDGEYTVELALPEETKRVDRIEVRMDNAADFENLEVALVSMTCDGEETDISAFDPKRYPDQDFAIVYDNNGDEDKYPQLAGKKNFTVTVNVSGLSGAAEDESAAEESSEGSESSSEQATDEDSSETDAESEAEKSEGGSDGPTLAFDSDDWDKYISTFDETEKGGLELKNEKDAVYQGAAIKLTADVTDPIDYSKDSDTAMGVVLKAEDFGLEAFDGYTLNLFSRFDENVKDNLYENSVYMYGKNGDGDISTSPVKKISYSESTNVNNFEKQFFTIPLGTNTKEVYVKVPLSKKYKGNVMYFDNLSLIDNASQTLATLDTYNKNADVKDAGDVVKQGAKENEVADTKIDKESDKFPVKAVAIGGGVLAAVAVVVVVLVIKRKNRFY